MNPFKRSMMMAPVGSRTCSMCEYVIQMVDRKLQENPFVSWTPLEQFVDPESASHEARKFKKVPLPPMQPPPEIPFPPAWRRPPPDPELPTGPELASADDQPSQVGADGAVPSAEVEGAEEGDDEDEDNQDVADDGGSTGDEDNQDGADDGGSTGDEDNQDGADDGGSTGDEDNQDGADDGGSTGDEDNQDGADDGGSTGDEDNQDEEGRHGDHGDTGNGDGGHDSSQSVTDSLPNAPSSGALLQTAAASGPDETLGAGALAALASTYDPDFNARRDALARTPQGVGLLRIPVETASEAADVFAPLRHKRSLATQFQTSDREVPAAPLDLEATGSGRVVYRSGANSKDIKDIVKQVKGMGGSQPVTWPKTSLAGQALSALGFVQTGAEAKTPPAEQAPAGETAEARAAGAPESGQEASARPGWAQAFLQVTAESDALHAARIQAAIVGLPPAEAALAVDAWVRKASAEAVTARQQLLRRAMRAEPHLRGSAGMEEDLAASADRFAEQVGSGSDAFASSLLQASAAGASAKAGHAPLSGFEGLVGDLGTLPTPNFDKAERQSMRDAKAFAKANPDVVADDGDPMAEAAAKTAEFMKNYRFKGDLPAGMDAAKMMAGGGGSGFAQPMGGAGIGGGATSQQMQQQLQAHQQQMAEQYGPGGAGVQRFRGILDMGFGGAPTGPAGSDFGSASGSGFAPPSGGAGSFAAQFAAGAQAAFQGGSAGFTSPGQAQAPVPVQDMPGDGAMAGAAPGGAMWADPRFASAGMPAGGQMSQPAQPAMQQQQLMQQLMQQRMQQQQQPMQQQQQQQQPTGTAAVTEAPRFRAPMVGSAAAPAVSAAHRSAAAAPPAAKLAADEMNDFRSALVGIATGSTGGETAAEGAAPSSELRFRNVAPPAAGAQAAPANADSTASNAITNTNDSAASSAGAQSNAAPQTLAGIAAAEASMRAKAATAAKTAMADAADFWKAHNDDRATLASTAKAAASEALTEAYGSHTKVPDISAALRGEPAGRHTWGLPRNSTRYMPMSGGSSLQDHGDVSYHGLGVIGDLKGEAGEMGGATNAGWTGLNTYPADEDDAKYRPVEGTATPDFTGAQSQSADKAQKLRKLQNQTGLKADNNVIDPAALNYAASAVLPPVKYKTGPRESYRALYRMERHKRFYKLYNHVMDAMDDVCKGLIPRQVAKWGCRTLYSRPARVVDWMLHGYQADEVCVRAFACTETFFLRSE